MSFVPISQLFIHSRPFRPGTSVPAGGKAHTRAAHPQLRVQVPTRVAEYATGLSSRPRLASTEGVLRVPDVSILICVYGKLELTRKCLDAIAATAPEGRYEVIVVDNASPDGSGDALEALAPCVSGSAESRPQRREPRLRRRQQPRRAARDRHAPGSAQQRHRAAARLARGAARRRERVPTSASSAPSSSTPTAGCRRPAASSSPTHRGWNYGRGGDPTDPRFNFVRAVDYCSGACLLVPRAVWDELGGFDERYAPAYYEDTDLCFAVRERGLEVVYQPAAAIVHHEGATAGTDTASGFKQHQVVNRERFREKWADALRAQQPPHPALVRRASHRVAGERLLVIDPLMPMFDRASGSRRMFELLRLLAGAGPRRHVRRAPTAPTTAALRRRRSSGRDRDVRRRSRPPQAVAATPRRLDLPAAARGDPLRRGDPRLPRPGVASTHLCCASTRRAPASSSTRSTCTSCASSATPS